MASLGRSLMAVVFVAIGVVFSPEKLNPPTTKLSMYIKLGHLLSYSIAWGSSFWVTFIASIIMFKNLPRHQFGNLQSKIFPAYFLMLGICCAISVAAFGYLHPWKSSAASEKYHLGFLILAFALSLANLFVFTPFTALLMKEKHKVEREFNIGDEVGWSENVEGGAKVNNNPKLAEMKKKFGMIHGLSYLANMLAFETIKVEEGKGSTQEF